LKLVLSSKLPRSARVRVAACSRFTVRWSAVSRAADRLHDRGGQCSAFALVTRSARTVPVSAEFGLALQAGAPPRRRLRRAVVTVAHVSAGSMDNAIADTAFVEGTIRTLSAGRRAEVVAPADRAAYRVAVERDDRGLRAPVGYPVTVNNARVAVRVLKTAAHNPDTSAPSRPVPVGGSPLEWHCPHTGVRSSASR
jgi:metal-dependent amidase/aminoacylase/carboxypeptidase family protein